MFVLDVTSEDQSIIGLSYLDGRTNQTDELNIKVLLKMLHQLSFKHVDRSTSSLRIFLQ